MYEHFLKFSTLKSVDFYFILVYFSIFFYNYKCEKSIFFQFFSTLINVTNVYTLLGVNKLIKLVIIHVHAQSF